MDFEKQVTNIGMHGCNTCLQLLATSFSLKSMDVHPREIHEEAMIFGKIAPLGLDIKEKATHEYFRCAVPVGLSFYGDMVLHVTVLGACLVIQSRMRCQKLREQIAVKCWHILSHMLR